MLKWLGKVLGGNSPELPEGVPASWVESLEKLLDSLGKPDKNKGKARDGLAQDILGYVLHGQPMAVLSEVSQDMVIAQHLSLVGGYLHNASGPQHDAFYKEFNVLPPAVALRWARLLEASAAPVGTSSYKMQLSNGIHWPEILLLNCGGGHLNTWSREHAKPKLLSAQMLEAMLIEDGQDPSSLLIAAFCTPVDVNVGYGGAERLLMVSELIGYADALDRHVEAIRPLLQPSAVDQRLHVLDMLEKAHPATLDRLAAELCELGVTNSKQVRAAAEVVLRRGGEPTLTGLRQLAVEGKPDQRVNALRLLRQLANERKIEELMAFSLEAAQADKAPSVQALVSEWEAAEALPAQGEQGYDYEVPVIDWNGTINDSLRSALDIFWQEADEAIAKSNKQSREHYERLQAQGYKPSLHQLSTYDSADKKAMLDYLASAEIAPQEMTKSKHSQNERWQTITPAIVRLAVADGVTPVVLFKVLRFFRLCIGNDHKLQHSAIRAFNALHRKTGRPTLIELSRMVEDSGFPGESMLSDYCRSWGGSIASEWEDAAVWPYFAHHVDLLVRMLTQSTTRDYSFDRNSLFRAVATLPTPPAAVVNALFSLALGSGKTDRLAAQEALQNLPGKEARIINALADGKAEVRTIAAQWLGRLCHEPAIPALEQAVQKEKNDVAKGALLDALQGLGQPVDKYLNREALAKEAIKALAKGLPKDLDWFPWNALPEVRWADTQASVTADTLRWLLVQAVKQKTPVPNAVLRKYCAMFEPRDREQLGQFVLETWLREDVRPIPPEQAMSNAKSHAQSMHHWMTQSPQYYKDSPHLGKSVEELTAYLLPSCLRQPQGSQTATKGLLAVASACAAERAAAPVQRYLKEWYGSRAAQGKALIAMLGWIEHPSATQLMLSIGSRFRTKSFQEEATQQAEALAERKGWTLAELADRTVPSAGFDENGELSLSYGMREFTAKLSPDFSVTLFNPDGKKIASLPEPRQDDDADVAKDSKKAFSAAKKEIKSIVTLQTERLYEALCTERAWPAADWRDYLQKHPVLRHLVQRLVWVEVVDGQVTRTFRPLDDGTLTDRDDNEVQLAEGAFVRLAHDSLLPAEEVEAWQQHLADYEIVPLFQQLGKGVYALPADKANADEIKDFEGYLIETFALRGRALKLGYTRGAAEDGGWFYTYAKRFPTLGMTATIEFTGNGLPEENRTVALTSLGFIRNGGGDDSEQYGNLPLSKVPKILISECYNDLRLIAAEGSGYDADWQKKSEY